ncbi:hypothetical protein L211DRAFT_838705 [Terfezia boudieri ATCC MYA-4762]|uniref:Uncharacterized protein n=1 Tax=Terfezia boudieri ATCC MYA-4762 TaxID=1051890 RepID=A0A3N4LND9_9PEZI|nr:hypothetical protein L211DRAFT_838705 [Terfezia boudieri ATCC MYA-4762]
MDAGLTSLAGLNNDLESLYDEHVPDHPPPAPIISGTTAVNFLQELGHYFQSLPVATVHFLQSPDQLKLISPILQSRLLPMPSGPYVSVEAHKK